MSVFNVLPSGVSTFFPTFWMHPEALFKKGLWLAACLHTNHCWSYLNHLVFHHNCQTITCTCQSSTFSPPESTHFFQRSGCILKPFSKKACGWRLVYTQITAGHI